MVGAQRQRRVVQRAPVLGDPLRLAAHLDDQGLGGQPQLLGRGDAEGAARQALDVHRGAGEGHRRVQGQRQGTGAQRGVQDPGSVPPGGVHQQLARTHRPRLGEPGHQAGQGVVGDGQQDQLGVLEDLRGRHERHVGEEGGGTPSGGVGDPGDGHRAVPGELEGRGQRGAHPSGADDAYGEPRGAVLGVCLWGCVHATAAFPFQSARGTGRFLVMLTRSVRAASRCPQAVGFRAAPEHTPRARVGTCAETGCPAHGPRDMIPA